MRRKEKKLVSVLAVTETTVLLTAVAPSRDVIHTCKVFFLTGLEQLVICTALRVDEKAT